jgi:hypothetical protein
MRGENMTHKKYVICSLVGLIIFLGLWTVSCILALSFGDGLNYCIGFSRSWCLQLKNEEPIYIPGINFNCQSIAFCYSVPTDFSGKHHFFKTSPASVGDDILTSLEAARVFYEYNLYCPGGSKRGRS